MPPVRRRSGPNRRDKWRLAVAKAKGLHPTTRLFLTTTLADHMKANGHVSHPRHRLAAEFGVSPRRISAHIQKAKETGWLTVVLAGHRGMTAEYQATFPNRERVTGSDTLSREKGNAYKHPKWVTETSPIPGVKGDENVTPVVVTTTTWNNVCVGDAHTCPCADCAEWRYAVDGLVSGMRRLNGLVLDSESNSKKPRHLRAVGDEA